MSTSKGRPHFFCFEAITAMPRFSAIQRKTARRHTALHSGSPAFFMIQMLHTLRTSVNSTNASRFTYLFWKSYREEGQREIFYPQVHAPDGPTDSTGRGLSHGWQGPITWVICCCFSQAINRKLDWKWNSRDTNLHPYGMLASQTAALPATPRHRPVYEMFLCCMLLPLYIYNHAYN